MFFTTDGSVASSMRYITGGTTYTNDDLSILPGAGTLQPFAGSLATPEPSAAPSTTRWTRCRRRCPNPALACW